jgi:N-acetylglucosamine-6-phosphate deacetylase
MTPPVHPNLEFGGDLFDFQVNGFAGVDFQRDELTGVELRRAVSAIRRHGVGRFFVALITDEIDRLRRRLERIEAYCSADPFCREAVAGYHMEGPWLSPEEGYRGAHPPGPMRAPRLTDFAQLQEAANGRIRLVTLAPEHPGSEEFIAAVVGGGSHVSLGHTAANDEQIDRAIRAGARFCTHLGNGVPAMLPRHDNVMQRLLARDELTACFIPDGVHIPPAVLRNLVRAKPPGRVLFTTDAMAGAGAPTGRYTLGQLVVDIDARGVARQPGGSGLAGSTLTPAEGVRLTAYYLGMSLAESRRLWSAAPIEAFGVEMTAERSS